MKLACQSTPARRPDSQMGSKFGQAQRSYVVMNLRQPLILYVPAGQPRVDDTSGFSFFFCFFFSYWANQNLSLFMLFFAHDWTRLSQTLDPDSPTGSLIVPLCRRFSLSQAPALVVKGPQRHSHTAVAPSKCHGGKDEKRKFFSNSLCVHQNVILAALVLCDICPPPLGGVGGDEREEPLCVAVAALIGPPSRCSDDI